MPLGQRIKQARGEISQTELSRMLKVDRSTVASWEVDRREPDLETLVRIADLFNVSMDWLSGYAESQGKVDVKEWEDLIAFAQANRISPIDLKHLIVSALNLRP